MSGALCSVNTTPARNNGWSSTTAMRIRSGISRFRVSQVEARSKPCPAARFRSKLEQTTKRLDPTAQSRQAQSARGRRLLCAGRRPGISDLDFEQSVVASCAERLAIALRMTECVVQPFLREAVQANFQ